jgi:hypothetical protein
MTFMSDQTSTGDDSIVTVKIDLNVRVRKNLTFSGLEDCSGPVAAGDLVHVVEPESGIHGDALVSEVDEELQLVYLLVPWGKLIDPEALAQTVDRWASAKLSE